MGSFDKKRISTLGIFLVLVDFFMLLQTNQFSRHPQCYLKLWQALFNVVSIGFFNEIFLQPR